ncbi:MAG: 3-phosphoshikimate 1-carboxyvinyltransferase [Ruminococcus sp.]|nr:3-phosphoshikimate 1-carboxyvinyltransferase [Ruminococcus sp.]
MIAKIKRSTAKGKVSAPTSKSVAHRMLICAALANGESQIHGVTFSQDIYATLDCIEAMGAKVEHNDDTVKINGLASSVMHEEKHFFCRESGSTLRFFVPILLLSSVKQSFSGAGRLMQRPMQVYEDICRERGLLFEQSETLTVKGKLTSGDFSVKGNISSQFITGLLFALSLADGISRIHIIPPLESRSYINMTIDAMKVFGVSVEWEDDFTLLIKGNQRYIAQSLTVEGDFSGSAFLDAFNVLGGEVEVTGMNENSLQGDKIYRQYFKLLADGTPTLDVSDCPDLAPILMTVAAAKNGAKLIGTKRLKIKESDRGVVMAQELSKFGAKIDVYENEIVVHDVSLQAPTSLLHGHNDHRIVMSLAVLSSLFGGEIDEAEAVTKSFPDFFEKIKTLGVEVEINDDK